MLVTETDAINTNHLIMKSVCLGDKEATIKAVKFETGHSKRIQKPIEMYKVACLVLALFAVAYAIPSAYGKNQKNWKVI